MTFLATPKSHGAALSGTSGSLRQAMGNVSAVTSFALSGSTPRERVTQQDRAEVPTVQSFEAPGHVLGHRGPFLLCSVLQEPWPTPGRKLSAVEPRCSAPGPATEPDVLRAMADKSRSE
jgi:hypothetical protein